MDDGWLDVAAFGRFGTYAAGTNGAIAQIGGLGSDTSDYCGGSVGICGTVLSVGK